MNYFEKIILFESQNAAATMSASGQKWPSAGIAIKVRYGPQAEVPNRFITRPADVGHRGNFLKSS